MEIKFPHTLLCQMKFPGFQRLAKKIKVFKQKIQFQVFPGFPVGHPVLIKYILFKVKYITDQKQLPVCCKNSSIMVSRSK